MRSKKQRRGARVTDSLKDHGEYSSRPGFWDSVWTELLACPLGPTLGAGGQQPWVDFRDQMSTAHVRDELIVLMLISTTILIQISVKHAVMESHS